MAPNQVTNENKHQVFKSMFPDIDVHMKPMLAIGDKVRILVGKELFTKGYKQNFSKTIYKISELHDDLAVDWYKVSKTA